MRMLLAILMCIAMVGCSTILVTIGDGPILMGGVLTDVMALASADTFSILNVLLAIDIPFSFAMDILMLPFSMIRELISPVF